jgi:hypothetical protein
VDIRAARALRARGKKEFVSHKKKNTFLFLFLSFILKMGKEMGCLALNFLVCVPALMTKYTKQLS